MSIACFGLSKQLKPRFIASAIPSSAFTYEASGKGLSSEPPKNDLDQIRYERKRD